MIAGQSTRYDEAIRLFRKALPHLAGERRMMARYGEWIAISLNDPDAKVKTPALSRTPMTAGEAIAQATAVAHMPPSARCQPLDWRRSWCLRFVYVEQRQGHATFWDPSFSVPLVPDYVAQVGLTYVHWSRWTATVVQSFVGPRLGSQYFVRDEGGVDQPSGTKLDSY